MGAVTDDPLRLVRPTLNDDQLGRAERSVEMVAEGPSITVRCPECFRRGYPPRIVGQIVWREERGHWDVFELRRMRDTPVAPRRPKLLAHGSGPATLRCRRCGWRESYRAATLGKRATDRGIKPGPDAVLYP